MLDPLTYRPCLQTLDPPPPPPKVSRHAAVYIKEPREGALLGARRAVEPGVGSGSWAEVDLVVEVRKKAVDVEPVGAYEQDHRCCTSFTLPSKAAVFYWGLLPVAFFLDLRCVKILERRVVTDVEFLVSWRHVGKEVRGVKAKERKKANCSGNRRA